MEEREIHIKDLLLQICLKWRIILVAMLIGAILFDGLSVVKSYRSAKAKSAQTTLQDIDLDSYRSSLTPWQVKATDRAFAAFEKSDKTFYEIKDHMETSIRMKTDISKIPTTYLYYEVTNCRNIEGLVNYIDFTMLADAWFTQMIDQLNLDVETNDLSGSLVVAEADGVDTLELEDQNNAKARPHYFYLKVLSTDEETGSKIADLFTQEMDKNMAEIQKDFPGIAIRLLSKSYREHADMNLASEKQLLLDKMNTAQNNANNFYNNMGDGQKEYFNALLRQRDIDRKRAEMEATGEEEVVEEPVSQPKIDFISVKYIFVGLVAGAFLACCLYLIAYLFSGRIHLSEELVEFFHMTILGELKKENGKTYKGLDALMVRIFKGPAAEFTEAERLDMICAGIRIAVNKQGMKKLHITGAASSAEAMAFQKELKEKLSDLNLDITTGRSVVYDPVSLDDLSSCDGVVVVEEIDQSIFNDIKQEVDFSKKYDIPIIGAVVLG